MKRQFELLTYSAGVTAKGVVMKRRTFMKTAGAAGAGMTLTGDNNSVGADSMTKGDTIPKRPYGDTGIHLSIIGFGGMVVNGAEQSVADKVVRDSIEAGINYFDVAPTYGNAEEKLGPALEPFRKDVFLACKSTERGAAGLRREMEQSLKTLRTDHFDLYQLHALTTANDIKEAFGPGGAMEAVEKAKEEGLINHIGFSSHSVESSMEALELFPFDSILVPINFVTWHNGGFGPQLVEYARKRGAAVLALKSMALTRLPQGTKREDRPYKNCWYVPVEDDELALKALRFTLSLPVTAAVPPGDEVLYRRAMKLGTAFLPLSAQEQDELKQAAGGVAPMFSYPSGSFNLTEKG